MKLFTIFFDYEGGTYINQTMANSPRLALRKWANQVQHEEIFGLGEKGKKHLISEIANFDVVEVSGIKNTWCTSTLIFGKLGIIHCIETVVA